MLLYKISHTTTYSYSETVPLCHNQVHLTPRDHERQRCVYHRLSVRPAPTNVEQRFDYFGNPVDSFTVQDGHQRLSVTAVSRVEISPAPCPISQPSPPWEDVRDWLRHERGDTALEAQQFGFDSRYVVASQQLADYGAASFTANRPWLEGLLDLTRRIFEDFVYDPTATTVSTPLATVLASRRGVCQDFAHLGIGCLRALGLPARYVSGYLLTNPPPGQQRLVGADASHAWLSAFCPALGWVDVDPTNNQVPSTKHVTLAWGRDYADVCPIRGVFIGGGDHSMTVSVDVLPQIEVSDS